MEECFPSWSFGMNEEPFKWVQRSLQCNKCKYPCEVWSDVVGLVNFLVKLLDEFIAAAFVMTLLQPAASVCCETAKSYWQPVASRTPTGLSSVKSHFEMPTLSGPHIVIFRWTLILPTSKPNTTSSPPLVFTKKLHHLELPLWWTNLAFDLEKKATWLCTREETLQFRLYLRSFSVFVSLPESHKEGLIDGVSVYVQKTRHTPRTSSSLS